MPQNVTIEVFQGLHSAQDPYDLAPGQAMEQVNCWSPLVGQLVIRPGIREMTSDTE